MFDSGKPALSSMYKIVSLYMVNGSAMIFSFKTSLIVPDMCLALQIFIDCV